MKAIVNAATAVNEAIAKTVVIVVTVAAAEAAAATAIVRLSIIIRRHLPLATAEAVKSLRIQHLAASHRLRVAEVGAREAAHQLHQRRMRPQLPRLLPPPQLPPIQPWLKWRPWQRPPPPLDYLFLSLRRRRRDPCLRRRWRR